MKGIIVQCIDLEPATAAKAKKMGILHIDLEDAQGYIATDSLGRKNWVSGDAVLNNYFVINNDDSIAKEDVERFIWKFKAGTIGKKTTVATATTLTGYEVTKTSACVNPKNYDIEIGKDIAYSSIVDELWEKLGFVLQWAINGVNPSKTKNEE
ncbi:MAG: Gp49 family protein [Clostridium sp.]|nr:Gp49 family protein [Clostridium sp.]